MTASAAQNSGFNVRDFARTARGNHREELHLEEFATTRLDAQTLRAVALLRDLESATMQRLRNVLVTPTHKDARVTAFLVTWAFEKFWIADALTAVLEANEYSAPPSSGRAHKRHPISEAGDRRGPIRRAIAAIVIGPVIVGVHMTTELVDQWVTRAAYRQVIETSSSAALTTTIELVLDVKKRHEQFFAQEAQRRLSESGRAQRLTARSLKNAAWPIGAVDLLDDDRTFFERYTFGSAHGTTRATEIEAQVAKLPGIGEKVATTIAERLVP